MLKKIFYLLKSNRWYFIKFSIGFLIMVSICTPYSDATAINCSLNSNANSKKQRSVCDNDVDVDVDDDMI